jgi:glucuronokinase
LAYKVELSKVSGTVLNNIREKYDKGDALVHETLGELASVAEQGKEAIIARDYEKLNKLIDHNFDLRCKIMNISQSNMELVQTARNCEASAKFSGSWRSNHWYVRRDEMLQRLIVRLYERLMHVFIKPITI